MTYKKTEREIGSGVLICLLTFYFGFILNMAFWAFVWKQVDIHSFSVFIFTLSLPVFIGVPLYLVFNLIVVPVLAKPLVSLLLILSAAANYMMFRYGVLIDTDMVRNIFETNPREAMDLMTVSGGVWVFVSGVLPAVWLWTRVIRYQPLSREIVHRLLRSAAALALVALFAATSYKEYASFGRNNPTVRKMLNTINYTYSTVRYFQKKAQSNRTFQILDKNAHLDPYEDPDITLFIIMIGETARAQNFALNGYSRPTNPKLMKKNIVNFSDVSSCGTATAISVPCLFSPHPRSNFEVDDAKYMENLLDILQKAGYDILWRENDDGCKGVCSRVPTEDMVDMNIQPYCKKDYCYDEALLSGLEDKIRNIKKDTVIVLHMMGSHGPTYYNRYPDAFKVFEPTCDTADIQNCTREQIVNTYDNTLVYTDHVIAGAIDILKKFPQFESGLLYVSDHGESLGENNIYLHGLPYRFAPEEQTKVPMVIWMSESMKKYDHIDYDCLKKKAAVTSLTHDHIFHSVLSLMEVDSRLYDTNLDLFNTCRTKPLPSTEDN